MKMMAKRHTVFRCSSLIIVKDFGWWFGIFLQRTAAFAQGIDDMRLTRGIGQLGADGHVAELGIQHLILRVRQMVLLLGRLIAEQDIQKHQTGYQSDQRILLLEALATKFISVQPTLYVMCIGHAVNLQCIMYNVQSVLEGFV